MNKFSDRAQFWGRFLLLLWVVILSPRAWALFDLQENWGFDQGGGYRQGNFVDQDASLVLVDQAWDEQRKLLAVGGAQGDDWAVRVYEIGPNGPNLLIGWTGSSDPRLEFSTITSLAWNSTNGTLLCGMEHTFENRSQASLLLLDLSEGNATELIALERWGSVVGVEESIVTTGEFWVIGEGDGGGLCRSVNPSIPEKSADNEFMLDEILRPEAMCQIGDQLWVAGKSELKKSFVEVYQDNKQVGTHMFNDDRFVSAMVSDGNLVYLTGREKSGNIDEMENLFLEAFEVTKKRIKPLWSATSESFKQDDGVGRAAMGREVGTSLLPLSEGGVLIGGYYQQYWKFGGAGSQMLAMLTPDLDGAQSFEGFIGRLDSNGQLLWAQSSGYRGNDFPLGLIPGGQDHALLLGNRKMSRGLGPFLERIKITGNVVTDAPLVPLSAQGLEKLTQITWHPQSTLRFGEAIDSRHLSATAPFGSGFVYELNDTRIEVGDFMMFTPGQLVLNARLLDSRGQELNATAQEVKGLKGRPYLKLVYEEVDEGIEFSTQLTNLHPAHLSGAQEFVQEMLGSINIKLIHGVSEKIDPNGFLPISNDFSGRLVVDASLPENTFYESATSRLSLHLRNGRIAKPEDESKLRMQVRDLNGWQKEKLVSPGTEFFISATQGFGKNRKFNKWVEFSEADQTLRTARVQSPFRIRTAVIAQQDMTLFAHYNFTFVGTAINGYLGGSTVFLDFNLNGKLDDDEPSGFSKTNGGFEIEVAEEDIQSHDQNNNGQLDPDEAMLVVVGGLDHSSKIPLAISYRAPPNYSVITAVSTLIAEFAEEGLSLTEAEDVVSQFLSLPEDIELSTFEPLREVFKDGEKARDFILKSTQLANLFNEGSRFLQVKSGNQITRIEGAELIVAAIHKNISEQNDRRSIGISSFIDLNDPGLLVEIITSAEILVDSVALNNDNFVSSSELSVRAELALNQPEIAELGNEQILNQVVEQIASANQSLDQLKQAPEVSVSQFKVLASASQNILNNLGEVSSNTLFGEEVDLLVESVGVTETQQIIDRSSEIESVDPSESPSSEGGDSLEKFNLLSLQEVSAENHINVYAPVLITSDIIIPTELNEEFILGSISAYDPEGNEVLYEIMGMNPDFDLDEKPMLKIDSITGQISIDDIDDLPLAADDILKPIVRIYDQRGLFSDEEISIDISSWANLGGRLHIPDLFLSVPENLPIGSVVHVFEKDDAFGGAIDYLLITGEGDTNNNLFNIDGEGRLITAEVFDYEKNEHELLIRLQASDSNFNVVEKSLSIMITDIILPNVQTGLARIKDSQLLFEGSMTLVNNSGKDLKFGFVYTEQSNMNEAIGGPFKVYSTLLSESSFVSQIPTGSLGGSLFYKAFVENDEGVRYGAEKTFVLPRITASEVWLDGSQEGEFSNWWRSDWFGLYYTQSYPWVFHQNLGWVHVFTDSSAGAWLFHQRLGWLWTTPDIFPFIYIHKREQWSYLNPERGKTTLFDYIEEEWFEPDTPVKISLSSNLPEGVEVRGFGFYYRWDIVTLEAKSGNKHNFAGWSGDVNSMSPVVTFEAVRDLSIDASFLALPSASYTAEKILDDARKILDKMSHLSDAEKEKSLGELLIYGKSATSGLSILQD